MDTWRYTTTVSCSVETHRFTVMGPDGGSSPNKDLLTPPFLTTTTDKFKWRKQVTLWSTTVSRLARGGNKRAKGILSSLGITLFNALDTVFAYNAERAITAGLVDLDLDDEDPATPTNQLELVRKIISIVAKDSATDGIRRLVQMMRDVFGCTRKSGESTAIYARRFQGLAFQYLNHCDAVAAEQYSQNFAMMLLENAKIPSSVYSTVVTQLVSQSQNTCSNPDEKILLISKAALKSIAAKAKMIENTQQASTTAPDGASQVAETLEYLAQSNGIKQLIRNTMRSNKRHEREYRATFRVALDDAVEALVDVKVDDKPKHDAHTPKALGSMMKKRKFEDMTQQPTKGGYRTQRYKVRIHNGEGPKANSKCKGCGEPNHWYKDPECI